MSVSTKLHVAAPSANFTGGNDVRCVNHAAVLANGATITTNGIVVPATGSYLIFVWARWTASATVRGAGWFKNGTLAGRYTNAPTNTRAGLLGYNNRYVGAGSNNLGYDLVAGDVLALGVYGSGTVMGGVAESGIALLRVA